MILDGADMVPATDDQAIVVSILVILAEFVRANILGTIGVVITAINLKSTKFAEQIEFATSTMKTMKIATPLKNKILEYLTSKQNDLDSQKELDSLMSMISPSLRHLISQHLFLSAIKDIAVFSKMPEVIEFLVLNLEGHQYMPEDFIIK